MNLLQLFSSPFFKALGWSLLHSLWQAAIVFLLAKIMLRILQQVKSSIKYIIAYSSVIIITLWFIVTLFRIYQQQVTSLSLNHFSTQNLQHDFARNTVHRTATFTAYVEHFLPVLLALYIAGLCVLSIRLFNSYIATIRLKSSACLHLGETWQRLAETLCDKIGLTKDIRLLLSETIDVPMTIGFIKPIILVPLAAVNSLSPEQMEAVLLHELSHIRRQDYLLNLIQSCIETVLFFNPFVQLMAQYIRKERENCCDEIVILHALPHDYAQALVTLEDARTQQYRLALTAVNKEPHLFNRIKKIMEMKKKNIVSLRQKLAALILAGIGLCSVAWISPNTGKEKNNTLKNQAVSAAATQPMYSAIDTAKVPPPPPPKTFPKSRRVPPPPPPPPPMRTKTDTAPMPKVSAFFESDAWKQQQQAIQKTAEKMAKQFNSPEWKQYQKNIMVAARKMQKEAEAFGKKFNSPEWKKQQYAFAQQAKKFSEQADVLNKKFDSPEWKKQQETFDRQTEKLKQYFQSGDWKEQQQKIQDQSEKLQEYFSRPDWKKVQDNIQHQSEKLQQYFQSKEWKEQQQKIQDQSRKLQEYFNSDEWKKAQGDMQDN